MFDFDLQMRMWRSAMDAFVHSSQASIAAAAAWQDQVTKSSQPESCTSANSSANLNPFGWMMPSASMWWLEPWSNMMGTKANTLPLLLGWPGPQTLSQTTWDVATSPELFSDIVASFWTWPTSQWAFFQTPMTAMMMSAGLPYNVASPSAKASTSAMDVADAAAKQMDNVFAAYRNDGGHTAAQIFALPLIFAAAFAAPVKPEVRPY